MNVAAVQRFVTEDSRTLAEEGTSTLNVFSADLETPQTGVAVCSVVFGFSEEGFFVLLNKDGKSWTLPVSSVRSHETLDCTAQRIMSERHSALGCPSVQAACSSFWNPYLKQYHLIVNFLSLVDRTRIRDDDNIRWFAITGLPRLLKHEINFISSARRTLQQKIGERPIESCLFPEKFTLSQLHRIYEVVFDHQIDRGNFEKKVRALGVLKGLEEWNCENTRRPARLYSFYTNEEKRHWGGGGLIFKSIERKWANKKKS